MSLSLAETQHLNRLADLLYGFLPGKPHPYADPRVSFRGIAQDLGLGRHWIVGSKLPAVTDLLVGAYRQDKGRFATLIREIVKRGLAYREAKEPVRREEIEAINDTLLKLKLRIKELSEPEFLDSLPRKSRPRLPDASASNAETQKPVDLSSFHAKLGT
jgi:hypothetical protein